MSNNIEKQANVQAVPFFARFLESQSSKGLKGRPQTLKYPSDRED